MFNEYGHYINKILWDLYLVNLKYVCRICDTEKIYIHKNYGSVHLLQFSAQPWFKLQAGANERCFMTSVLTLSNLSCSTSLHEIFGSSVSVDQRRSNSLSTVIFFVND